jgi:DHA3 family macrolide efflux protein-like MFS transporter
MVLDLTDGSTASTSFIVFFFVVPTVVFGIFSGVLVDRWSKRRLLILTNIGRAVAATAFFFGREHLWPLYITTVFFASFSQLFTTSTAASIPFMVTRKQLISANTLFSGAFTVAQIAGLIILSPVIINVAGRGDLSTGVGALFVVAGAVFLVAALLARLLPYIGNEGEDESHSNFPGRAEMQGAVAEFARALGSLRKDPVSSLAMAHITISSTLILLFAVLVPKYMQAILKVGPEDAVAVFAPVAFGALIGLRAVPFMVGRWGKTSTVALGLFGIAICVSAMGLVETIANLLERTDSFNPFTEGNDRIFGLSILVALTMLISGPMGFAYALVNTPAQTTLHERTPVEMRGRVIASQMVMANGVALIPLVVMGGIADLYGVSSVVLAIGVLMALAAALTLYLDRRWVHSDTTPPAAAGDDLGEARSAVSRSIDTT